MARRLILALTVAFVAVACADEAPAFEPDTVIDAVQAEVRGVGIDVVDCPYLTTSSGESPAWAELPEVGGSFTCDATLHDDPVSLAVTVAPAVDGELAVAADVETPLFDVAVAEAAAATRLDADLGGSPEVDCVERLVVISPGRRVDCRVTAEGGTAGPVDRTLAIVILDAAGNWEIDLFTE